MKACNIRKTITMQHKKKNNTWTPNEDNITKHNNHTANHNNSFNNTWYQKATNKSRPPDWPVS